VGPRRGFAAFAQHFSNLSRETAKGISECSPGKTARPTGPERAFVSNVWGAAAWLKTKGHRYQFWVAWEKKLAPNGPLSAVRLLSGTWGGRYAPGLVGGRGGGARPPKGDHGGGGAGRPRARTGGPVRVGGFCEELGRVGAGGPRVPMRVRCLLAPEKKKGKNAACGGPHPTPIFFRFCVLKRVWRPGGKTGAKRGAAVSGGSPRWNSGVGGAAPGRVISGNEPKGGVPALSGGGSRLVEWKNAAGVSCLLLAFFTVPGGGGRVERGRAPAFPGEGGGGQGGSFHRLSRPPPNPNWAKGDGCPGPGAPRTTLGGEKNTLFGVVAGQGQGAPKVAGGGGGGRAIRPGGGKRKCFLSVFRFERGKRPLRSASFFSHRKAHFRTRRFGYQAAVQGGRAGDSAQGGRGGSLWGKTGGKNRFAPRSGGIGLVRAQGGGGPCGRGSQQPAFCLFHARKWLERGGAPAGGGASDRAWRAT